MSEKNCPFCSPGQPVLKDNKQAKVLLSDPHKVPGHMLVVPKRHVEKPWDLTHAELTGIFDLIFSIEQKIIGKLGDGVDIRQNYRPFLQQGNLKVNHLTFHVIPRAKGDYLYSVSEQYEDQLYADLDDIEASAVANLLMEPKKDGFPETPLDITDK
jgi:diadenosine tetraphosphate (Ap4A) HIT family hydrolase